MLEAFDKDFSQELIRTLIPVLFSLVTFWLGRLWEARIARDKNAAESAARIDEREAASKLAADMRAGDRAEADAARRHEVAIERDRARSKAIDVWRGEKADVLLHTGKQISKATIVLGAFVAALEGEDTVSVQLDPRTVDDTQSALLVYALHFPGSVSEVNACVDLLRTVLASSFGAGYRASHASEFGTAAITALDNLAWTVRGDFGKLADGPPEGYVLSAN